MRKTIKTPTKCYSVEAVVKTPMERYYAVNEPTISQTNVAFTGVPIASLSEGHYTEPKAVIVSTPYAVEFM